MRAIIDAHQHYWLLSRGDYGWLSPDGGLLYEDYLPERAAPELRASGVRASVVVQAAPTVAEAKYLLGLAEQEETIAGVVGWMDLESPEFEETLTRLAAHPLFVGIRPDWPRDEDGRLRLSERLRQSLRILAQRRFPVDLLMGAAQLPDAAKLLEAEPELRVVVNHIGGPTHREEDRDNWMKAMSDIASFPEAYCKLSGMITKVPKGADFVEALRPYVDHLVNVFGPSRLLFGSDWPVCRLAGEYADTVTTLEALIAGLPENAQDDIFGGNAARVYRLQRI